MRTLKLLAVLSLIVTGLAVDSQAQTGAYSFAVQLNNSGGLYHDSGFNGYEVVYRSSGTATEAGAHQAWQNSPGHARLVNAGLITEVQCVGSVCVGRGYGSQAAVRTRQTVTVRTGPPAPVRTFLNALRPKNIVARVQSRAFIRS